MSNTNADFHDPRVDYDDRPPAHTLTPRELLQRKVRVPAIAFIVIGVLGVLTALGFAIGIPVMAIDDPVADELLWSLMLMWAWFMLMLALVFGLCIRAGRRFLQFKSYRLVLLTAYFVTSLSLAGFWAVLFFPFGIWALVLLYRPDIRQEFQSPPKGPSS